MILKREAEVRKWANHSIVSKRKIKLGEKITEDMITVKRPSGGIEAKYFRDIIDYKAVKPILANQMLGWDDIKK